MKVLVPFSTQPPSLRSARATLDADLLIESASPQPVFQGSLRLADGEVAATTLPQLLRAVVQSARRRAAAEALGEGGDLLAALEALCPVPGGDVLARHAALQHGPLRDLLAVAEQLYSS